MRLRWKFQTCFVFFCFWFFFYEKILRVKNTDKRKTSDFHLLRSLCAQKIVAFVVLLLVHFCFISWFFVCECFLSLKSFRRKNNKQVWNFSRNLNYVYYWRAPLSTYLWRIIFLPTAPIICYHTYLFFICAHLFSSFSYHLKSILICVHSFWSVRTFFMITCENLLKHK